MKNFGINLANFGSNDVGITVEQCFFSNDDGSKNVGLMLEVFGTILVQIEIGNKKAEHYVSRDMHD